MVNREKYLIRALHYFVRLLVLVGVALIILYLVGLLNTSGMPIHKTLFSARGGILLIALVLLSAIYPRFGFGAVEVKGDMDANREQLLKAFADYDYTLIEEDKDKMVFRANSKWQRLVMQYDDAVTVTQITQYIAIEGHRKHIGRIEARLEMFIRESQSN